jgi:hypothetical protein
MPVQCGFTGSEVMEGREPVGVTVVVLDTSNGPVTIEAVGTVALVISADAIVTVHRMFLTTPPSILPLRAGLGSNARARGLEACSRRISQRFAGHAAHGGPEGYPIC